MSNSMKIEMVVAACLATILASTWYFFWVKPYNEMLYWMRDCAGDDHARAVWDACHKKFLNHKAVSLR